MVTIDAADGDCNEQSLQGAIVRVRGAGGPDARRLQREAARAARDAGAAHVVLDPPEREVQAQAAAEAGGTAWRSEGPAAAVRRWFAAHQAPGVQDGVPQAAVEEALDAVAAAEGGA